MGRHKKVGRPRKHNVGWKGHKRPGRPRKVGRPKGIHTKWKKSSRKSRRRYVLRNAKGQNIGYAWR